MQGVQLSLVQKTCMPCIVRGLGTMAHACWMVKFDLPTLARGKDGAFIPAQ